MLKMPVSMPFIAMKTELRDASFCGMTMPMRRMKPALPQMTSMPYERGQAAALMAAEVLNPEHGAAIFAHELDEGRGQSAAGGADQAACRGDDALGLHAVEYADALDGDGVVGGRGPYPLR